MLVISGNLFEKSDYLNKSFSIFSSSHMKSYCFLTFTFFHSSQLYIIENKKNNNERESNKITEKQNKLNNNKM